MMLLVTDFDAALRFYREALGMQVATDLGSGASRLLQLEHPGLQDEIWLVLAESAAQHRKVGRQGHEVPLGVIYTADLDHDCQRLSRLAHPPLSEPVRDPDGARHCRVADLYGNLWVLVQPTPTEGKRRASRKAKVMPDGAAPDGA